MKIKNKLLLSVFFTLVSVGVYAEYNQDIVIETLLKTDTTALGQRISYPHDDNAEVTICKVIIPPGKFTGWHKHIIPVFAYVVQGTLTVEDEKGNTHIYTQNSTISEVYDTYHNGINKGDEAVVLIAIYLGVKGVQVSEKMPDK